jgi:hypothetical protein
MGHQVRAEVQRWRQPAGALLLRIIGCSWYPPPALYGCIRQAPSERLRTRVTGQGAGTAACSRIGAYRMSREQSRRVVADARFRIAVPVGVNIVDRHLRLSPQQRPLDRLRLDRLGQLASSWRARFQLGLIQVQLHLIDALHVQLDVRIEHLGLRAGLRSSRAPVDRGPQTANQPLRRIHSAAFRHGI